MDMAGRRQSLLGRALARWQLMPDGETTSTATGLVLPVRQRHAGGIRRAMLKVSDEPEETRAMPLMRWWCGDGAAEVFALDEGALLMERAADPGSLLALAQHDDDAATRIICTVAARLHRRRGAPPDRLVPLEKWFAPLLEIGPREGGPLARAARIAARLLSAPGEVVPLHGDLHHENVLDFGGGNWRAIDPKGLLGDRGFDYAILFCDPDLGRPEIALARRPEIFRQRLAVVSTEAGIDRARLLDWILAWSALSWSWAIEDRTDAPIERSIFALAIAESDG